MNYTEIQTKIAENKINESKVRKQVDLLNQKISTVNKELEKIDEEINGKVAEIDKKYLSIAIDEIILKLPKKANGTSLFSEKLNLKSEKYDSAQFNKITRFLTLIENSELDYNNSYNALTRTYRTSPNKQKIEILINKSKLLLDEYLLMDVLINSVDSDKVMFNKVYNTLEDRGVFLSNYDKLNYENLALIASNSVTLVSQNYIANNRLQSISNGLWELNSNVTELNDGISDVSNSIKSLHGSVKTGNFLNAVQTYQLYKIQKNTKSLN